MGLVNSGPEDSIGQIAASGLFARLHTSQPQPSRGLQQAPVHRAMLGALVLFLAHLGSSNIVFDRIDPTCDPSQYGQTGCLRGQQCLANGTCIPEDDIVFNTFPALRRITSAMAAQVSSVLGRQIQQIDEDCDSYDAFLCGSSAGDARCCAELGYCEITGCLDEEDFIPVENATPTLVAENATLTPSNPSASTSDAPTGEEPVLGIPRGAANAAVNASQVMSFSKDGSCGASFGGVVCGNWPRGSCCSMYGYCGKSSAHCGAGCQSGPCILEGPDQQPRPKAAPDNPVPGSFKVVADSGVPAMHVALLPNAKVLFLDKVENFTKLLLSSGQHAYASEWDPTTKRMVPLTMKTNPFCSGGAFTRDGTLLSIGGNGPLTAIDPTVADGFRGIRALQRSITSSSLDGRSFDELGNLSTSRWYPSTQTLSDGRIFVASGSLNGLDPTRARNNNPTYEFLSASGAPITESEPLDILVRSQPYYMYPFMHLLRTGDMFIFVSKSSELWSPSTKKTGTIFPDLPGDYRTYPNTGSSVLLPLSSRNLWDPEVIVCGGGAYQDLTSPTDPSCGRIAPLEKNADWEMDAMPEGRGMLEGVLIPDGTIVFLNGCTRGAQGFGLGQSPARKALLYNPKAPLGKRWSKLAASPIPRLYHSVALLLLDGTIMIAGSNPVEQPVLRKSRANPFITEFRVEIYTPPYLSGPNARRRPTNVKIDAEELKADGSSFEISVTVPTGAKRIEVALYNGGFVTHSLHMGQRMMFLDVNGFRSRRADQVIKVTMPPNGNIAPPGPYVVFVLADGVPSIGQFVLVS